MTKEQFFEAFVAALRTRGAEFVITEGDRHHRSFAAAVKVLDDARASDPQAAAGLPRGLVGDEITGRFHELDSALTGLQFSKFVGAQNPTYRRVHLTLDDRTASRILGFYSEPQQQLFRQMADEFSRQGSTAA